MKIKREIEELCSKSIIASTNDMNKFKQREIKKKNDPLKTPGTIG